MIIDTSADGGDPLIAGSGGHSPFAPAFIHGRRRVYAWRWASTSEPLFFRLVIEGATRAGGVPRAEGLSFPPGMASPYVSVTFEQGDELGGQAFLDFG